MTSASAITLAHRVSRSDQVMFQELDGEAVLLDLSGEVYFGLNEAGTRIWKLIEASPALAEVHRVLCRDYDADSLSIERDLLALMQSLAEAGLVRVH